MTTGTATSAGLVQNLAALSFDSMITRLFPGGSAPLFGLTSMLPAETALQTEHGFFTKTMIFPSFSVTADATSADTTLTVNSSANIVAGMLFRINSTAEHILVTSVPTSTSITVQRARGGSAAAITSGMVAYQIGTAYEESSLRPGALSIQEVRVSNLTQIFRNTWAVSGTLAAVQVIAGDGRVAENKQDCAMFHAMDIERSLFFGKKYAGTLNGRPFRTMDGIINIVSSSAYYPAGASVNVTTAGSTTNYTQLETALDPVFNQVTDPKSSAERLVFVGGTAKKVLNNIGRLNGTYQLVDNQTNWGLQFSTFKTARGMFRLIEHPLFNSNTNWSKMAVVVDIPSFCLAYLAGRKTSNMEFNTKGDQAQDNGVDAVGGTLTTECTCLVRNPPACAVIYNLTAGAQG
jgi:hypothetical protein